MFSSLQPWLTHFLVSASQLTFAEAKSMPKVVRIMHSHAVTGPFQRIGGDVLFGRKAAKDLEHLFDAGPANRVLNYLQIVFVGLTVKAYPGERSERLAVRAQACCRQLRSHLRWCTCRCNQNWKLCAHYEHSPGKHPEFMQYAVFDVTKQVRAACRHMQPLS